MSEVIISNEELEAAAKLIYARRDIDDVPVTLTQVKRAFTRWLDKVIEDRLTDPNDFIGQSFSSYEDDLNIVRAEDAEAWCKANGATIEKIESPWGKGDRWTRITTKDGTSAEGFDLARAFDNLQEKLVNCYWCGKKTRVVVEGGRVVCGTCGRDWQGEAA